MSQLDLKILNAMHRIEDLYNDSDGKCFVSFSGGKDSMVLLALIRMCEDVLTIPLNGIKAVFFQTGIELGVTSDFVKWAKENYYPNLDIIRPEKTFDWIIRNKGKPIKSKVKSELLERWHRGARTRSVAQNLVLGLSNQGKKATRSSLADKDFHMIHDDFSIKISGNCCKYMKKMPSKKYAKEHEMKGIMTGLRSGEGGARNLNAMARKTEGHICTFVRDGVIYKTPIIDWSDEDVEEFVEKYHVPLSRAYTEFGFRRTGCMCCPFSLKIEDDLKYLFYHEPNRYKAAMHWLKDVYIAQNVILPFDEEYERERERTWQNVYEPMRQEMLRKYRPNSRLIKEEQQLTIDAFL